MFNGDLIESEPTADHRPIAPAIQRAIAPDRSGWKARLKLNFEHHQGKTIVRREHTGPLMVQRPFYPEGDSVCHTYVLHPPGGIVGSDQLLLETFCADSSAALITTPGATKYYGSNGRHAAQHQHITIGNAALEWMPQESIYFDSCRALQSLQVNLTSQSRFIGWDINCLGRPAGDNRFVAGLVCNRVQLFKDDKPLLHERLQVSGADDLNRLSGMRGAVVHGMLVATLRGAPGDEIIQAVRAVLPADEPFFATNFDDLILVRYLGDSAESARRGFVSAWRVLRPVVIGRDVVEPRIWAT